MSKFTRVALGDVVARDSATLLSELGDKFNAKTLVEFTCSCGNAHTKNLECCINYGIFCKPCARKLGVLNSRKTKAIVKVPINPDAASYLLRLGDDEPEEVDGDAELTLSVLPKFLNTRMYADGISSFTVTWWDTAEHRNRVNRFSKKLYGDAVKDVATKFASDVPAVPDGYIVTISVRAIVANLPYHTDRFCFTRKRIEYPPVDVPIDPYAIGSWLGDGTAAVVGITTVDSGILSFWKSFTESWGLKFVQSTDLITYRASGTMGKRSPLTDEFRKLNLIPYPRCAGVVKHIPDIYKYNSREVRMKVVAGLIDTDGTLGSCGMNYGFCQSLGHERLYDDLKEVVESLGYRMTKRYITNTCPHKDGGVVYCPAIRGSIIGDDSLMELPLLIEYKKIKHARKKRYDLQKFTITELDENVTPL
jgi:hypothetical protein